MRKLPRYADDFAEPQNEYADDFDASDPPVEYADSFNNSPPPVQDDYADDWGDPEPWTDKVLAAEEELDEGKMSCTAVHAFETDQDGELPCARGERVLVERADFEGDNDGWVYCDRTGGRKGGGYVPAGVKINH